MTAGRVGPLLLGGLLLACALLARWLWTPDLDRRLLESRYLAAPGDLVQVGVWRLHLRDSGPTGAPVLILIHGFGASLHTWDAWATALSDRHRVIRFDLPGSGLSLPDPDGDYTDTRSIALLCAVMDQAGVARASIAGHSIGGRIAWTFAAQHPARVDKLVLVAPDGYASPGFAYGQPPQVPAALTLMRYLLPRALLRMNLLPAYADPAALTDERLTRYHDLLRAPGARDALLARLRQTVLVDPQPMLKTLRAPTLLVWGERDTMIPITNAADYLKTVPDIRLAALPAVGHLPQEEAAAASLVPVRAFLE
jgi:pimeloyl-ACP methyl ester carboxylesterase